ncbi:hypothetical protein ACJ8PQ_01290, partial [Serratia sp. CY74664]|uniref:hypothetical protein n=1 Tax=Serratia sp. CY74664 TaxID=3383676 RepID=UPI003F9F602D
MLRAGGGAIHRKERLVKRNDSRRNINLRHAYQPGKYLQINPLFLSEPVIIPAQSGITFNQNGFKT